MCIRDSIEADVFDGGKLIVPLSKGHCEVFDLQRRLVFHFHTSVSYTHLDVYKRQADGTVIPMAGYLIQQRFWPGEDVYKRQVHRRFIQKHFARAFTPDGHRTTRGYPRIPQPGFCLLYTSRCV